MADKRTTPGAVDAARRRRRAAPTIDLTATEIESGSAAAPPQQPPPEPPPRIDPEPAGRGPTREFLAADRRGTMGKIWAWARRNISATTLAAGLTGAVLVSLVMFALWLTGLVPIRYAGTTATRARVSVLEMEVRALREHPADGKTIDALTQRVGKLDEAVAKLPGNDSAAAERLNAADNAMKSLGIALTALNRRSDDVAASAADARSRADAATTSLDALDKRIAALEDATRSAHGQIAKNSGADLAARLALSAAALRDATVRGEPFTAELAAVKTLGGDNAALAPLEPFAASGIPGDTMLAQQLDALVPVLVRVSGVQAAASGSFFERLQANAGNLVRIRPVDEPPGDDPAAVLARIEVKAAHADIAGALDDLARLSDKARAPADAWIKAATARQTALEAARTFAAGTARALGKP